MAKRNPRSDTAAPDGIFSHGYRLVRPGGRVKAADTWFQHDALIPYVGDTVYVMMNDYWYSELICITDDLEMRKICTAKPVYPQKEQAQV